MSIRRTASFRSVWALRDFPILTFASAVLFAGILAAQGQDPPGPTDAGPKGVLRDLDAPGPYRTLRGGEGFRTEIFGMKIEEEPRNRRSVTAWDAGLDAVAAGITGNEVLPFAALYFYRRPDPDTYFRGVFVGLYNEALFARSTASSRPFEAIITFNSYTVPTAQAEVIDGKLQSQEELIWGHVRPGIGLGIREDLGPSGPLDRNDNMFAVSLVAEPGYLYFFEGSETAESYRVPQDTFEMQGRLRLRLDLMERNLFELAHEGWAFGFDLYGGTRVNWEDWGPGAAEQASGGRNFMAFKGFLSGATGIPGVASERHRLIGQLHGGIGHHLDRFSQFHIGGGPSGEEAEALSYELIPGAAIEEFNSDSFLTALGEYRWEPIFFAYLSLRTSVTYLSRKRSRDGGVVWSDDILPSTGVRLTSGFVFRTQLQVDYNYNFGVIRHGEFGGSEIMVHLSGEF